jgi:hypothetical protein
LQEITGSARQKGGGSSSTARQRNSAKVVKKVEGRTNTILYIQYVSSNNGRKVCEDEILGTYSPSSGWFLSAASAQAGPSIGARCGIRYVDISLRSQGAEDFSLCAEVRAAIFIFFDQSNMSSATAV